MGFFFILYLYRTNPRPEYIQKYTLSQARKEWYTFVCIHSYQRSNIDQNFEKKIKLPKEFHTGALLPAVSGAKGYSGAGRTRQRSYTLQQTVATHSPKEGQGRGATLSSFVIELYAYKQKSMRRNFVGRINLVIIGMWSLA